MAEKDKFCPKTGLIFLSSLLIIAKTSWSAKTVEILENSHIFSIFLEVCTWYKSKFWGHKRLLIFELYYTKLAIVIGWVFECTLLHLINLQRSFICQKCDHLSLDFPIKIPILCTSDITKL